MTERLNDALPSHPAPWELAQIRLVADHLPQLAWSCLPNGHCDYVSSRWVEFTGVSETEHHGNGWLNAVYPADRKSTQDVWNAFVQGVADYDVDYRLRRYDGECLWFKTRGVLLRNGNGVPPPGLAVNLPSDFHYRLTRLYNEASRMKGVLEPRPVRATEY